MLPQFDLTGRRVLITGAGRGIGKGIAIVMAEAGCDVAITSLGGETARNVASEVEKRGRRGFGYAADGTKVEDTERLAEQVFADLGGLDILVNCLGDSISGALAEAPSIDRHVLSESDWHSVIDVNLTQAYVGCHVFGPTLLKQRSGSVINISSFASIRPAAYQTAYASAKAGLTLLTQSLALEWAPFGIRVNAISPGSFPDPDLAAQRADQQTVPQPPSRQQPPVPLGRPGDVREVGYLCVYLASDAAAYITGQNIAIDGGRTLT
ncbi:MAG: SDR family oxidoreductase [Dehalococcoidia bacterium]|nr:SDR family oxidoreductase [Dehalococcoidia bacterium]